MARRRPKKISLKKAAASRPRTRMRVTHPQYKRAVNPELERSPRSGWGPEKANWRREVKNKKQLASALDIKDRYIKGKMASRFRQAMKDKKRRVTLQEAKERLEARDMHVTTLLKKSERAARRKAMQDARERNSQRTTQNNLDDSLSCRSKMLEARRQNRINEGLPPDVCPSSNLRSTPTKLSLRRASIKRILLDYKPQAAQHHNFEKLMTKWKGKSLVLLRNIREKYGIPSPAQKKKKNPTASLSQSPANLWLSSPRRERIHKVEQIRERPKTEREAPMDEDSSADFEQQYTRKLNHIDSVTAMGNDNTTDTIGVVAAMDINDINDPVAAASDISDLVTATDINDVVTATDIINHAVTAMKINDTVAATDIDDSVATTDTSDSVAATDIDDPVATTDTNDSVAATDIDDPVATTDINDSLPATDISDSVPVLDVNDPVATTDTKDSVAATDTNDSVAATDVNDSVAVTDTNDSVAATDVNDSVAATDINDSVAADPVAATEIDDPVAATDTNDPVAETDINDSVDAKDIKDPVATTDTNDAVAETDINDSVDAKDIKDPVATTDTNDAVAATDISDSVATTDIIDSVAADPVATTDINDSMTTDINDPVAATDTNDPVAETDTNDLVDAKDIKDPVATTDINDPVAATDTNDSVAKTDINDPVVADIDDEVAATKTDNAVALTAINGDGGVALATADGDGDSNEWRWYYQKADSGETRWQAVSRGNCQTLSERYKDVVLPAQLNFESTPSDSTPSDGMPLTFNANGYVRFQQDTDVQLSMQAVPLDEDCFASPAVGLHFQLGHDSTSSSGLVDQLAKGSCFHRLHRFQTVSKPPPLPSPSSSIRHILLLGMSSPSSALRSMSKHAQLVVSGVLDFLPQYPEPLRPYQTMQIDSAALDTCLDHSRPSFTVLGRRIAFPKPTGIRVSMMPIDLDDVPAFLFGYRHIIDTCAATLCGDKGKCYLTVYESFVPPGQTQRRAGVHTESSGGSFPITEVRALPAPDYHYKSSGHRDEGNFPNGIFFCSSVARTEIVYDSEVRAEAVSKCVCPGGSVEHLREAGALGTGFVMDAGDLVWMTDRTPHECIAVDREVHRQLFQLSVGPVSVWDEGDSMPDGLPPHANIVKDLVRALEETRRMGKEDSLPSTKAMQLSWAEWFDS